jgi:hypothetical protein
MRTWLSNAAALGLLLGTLNALHAADDAKPDAATPAAEAKLEPTPAVEAPDPIPFVRHDGLWGSIGPRLSVEYFTGPGFGYYNGYSSFDAFIPVFGSSLNHLVYVDARGILSDDNTLWGNNLGLGYRFYHPPLDRIFGAWTSWDLRNTNYATYNQVSAGVETIGRYLDFRNNYYIVTGPQYTETASVLLPQPYFQSTNVMLPQLVKFDSALSGTDMEAGGPVPLLKKYGVRAYAGGYVFHGDSIGQFGGAQGKLTARLSNNLDFSLQLRNDHVFGTTFVFGGALRWGGLKRALRDPYADDVYNRMADPVQRNYNVAVVDPIKVVPKAAIDPRTGQPVKVIHVDNQAAPGGNGTAEHPLNTLSGAPGLAGVYGIILVDRGDGTTRGLNQGAVLQMGQRLLGNSLNYTFLNQQFGILPLPNHPNGIPVITNLNGPAVTLASGTELAGVQLLGTGIVGSGVQNLNIHDVRITGAPNGILLTNVSGMTSITNTFVTGSTGDGASISTAGNGTFVLAVANSSFNGNGGNGFTLNAADNSMLTANFSGGAFNSNTGSGINLVSNNSAVMNVGINGGSKTGNGGMGVNVQQMGASNLTVNAVNDPISNNTGGGLSLASSGTGSLVANVSNSTLSGNTGGPGISASSSGSSTLALTLAGNTISQNTAGGVIVTAKDQSNATFTMTNNRIVGNGVATVGDGARVISTTSGSFGLQASGNHVENSGLAGIDVVAGGGAFTGTISGNTVIGSGDSGISFTANAGNSSVNVFGNTIQNSGGVGLVLTRSAVPNNGESSMPISTASAWNNTVSGSGRQGIYVSDTELYAAPPTAFTVNLNNNQTSGNQGAGISVMSLGLFGNSNLVVHAQGNTMSGDNAGGSDFAAFQANVTGVGGPASLGLQLTGNTVTAAQGDAFRLANTGGTFIFQDGGQNLPATYNQVGTITPGIVP